MPHWRVGPKRRNPFHELWVGRLLCLLRTPGPTRGGEFLPRLSYLARAAASCHVRASMRSSGSQMI